MKLFSGFSNRRQTKRGGAWAADDLTPEAPGRAERLLELAVMSLFLHSAGTMEEMLALFLERSPRVTGAVLTYPLLLDRRRDVLHASPLATVEDPAIERACMAANENLTDVEFPMPVRGWRREVMDSGEVAITDDLRQVFEEGLDTTACDALRKELRAATAAVVPLVMEGEAFGLCVFLFADEEPDVEVLELVAGHCTLALKALMAGEETTRFGGIDPVTWAHTRRSFMESLEQEVTRARRYSRGLSVVLFDIDDFGEFNATFGHTMGDRVLRALAMTLASCVEAPEMVARYGGDEFAILLPETNRAVAVELTAAIVRKIGALSILEGADGERQPISASVAIVSYPEDGGSRDELLGSAELGLEQAKAERRAASAPGRELTPVQRLRLSNRRQPAA